MNKDKKKKETETNHVYIKKDHARIMKKFARTKINETSIHCQN